MTLAEITAVLAPFVRIALYLVTGWISSEFIDPETVDLIRNEPALAALITGGIAAVWYAMAKRYGWAT